MPSTKEVSMKRALFLLLLSCVPEEMTEEPDTTMRKPQGPETSDESKDRQGSRLRRYVSVTTGADGTRIEEPTTRFRDTKLNTDCSPMDIGDGTMICAPFATTNTVSLYTDSGCTNKIEALAVRVECGKAPVAPEWLNRDDPTACPRRITGYQRIASASHLAMVYFGSPGSCSPGPTTIAYYSFDPDKLTNHSTTDFVQVTRNVELAQ
jgi:hypothetical protein